MEENYQIEELDKNNKKVNPELIVLVKQVGQKPKFMKIKNEVSEIEGLVGGHIDTYNIDDVVVVFNENHENLNLKPNIAIDLKVIFGDCFIVGDDYINGEFKSLSKNQIIKYAKFLSTKSFTYDNEAKIIAERKKYLEKKGLVNNLESGIGQKEDMLSQVNTMISNRNQILNTNPLVNKNLNTNRNQILNTNTSQFLNENLTGNLNGNLSENLNLNGNLNQNMNQNIDRNNIDLNQLGLSQSLLSNNQVLNKENDIQNGNNIKENEMLDIDDLDLYLEDEKVDETKKQKKRGRKPKKDKIKQEIIKENLTLEDVNKMDFKDLNALVDKLVIKEMKNKNLSYIEENNEDKINANKENNEYKESKSNSKNNLDLNHEEDLKQELINNDLSLSNQGLIITNDVDNQLIDEIRLTLYKVLLNQTYIYRKLKKIENSDNK